MYSFYSRQCKSYTEENGNAEHNVSSQMMKLRVVQILII